MSTGPERGKQREAAERFSQERMGWRKQVGGSLHLRTGSPEKDGSTMPRKHNCQEPWDTLLHSRLPRPPDHGPKKTRPVRVSWGSEMTPFLQLLPPPSPTKENTQGLRPGGSKAHRAPSALLTLVWVARVCLY